MNARIFNKRRKVLKLSLCVTAFLCSLELLVAVRKTPTRTRGRAYVYALTSLIFTNRRLLINYVSIIVLVMT